MGRLGRLCGVYRAGLTENLQSFAPGYGPGRTKFAWEKEDKY